MYNSKSIMLIEDDDVDAITVRRALDDLKVNNSLIRKIDGEDALNYLEDKANPKPCVILLDLNMPRMNGIEFLKAIKANPVLKRIPVVVLTTSDAEQNILESYDSGVAGYIVKPVDYKQFVEAVRTLNMYWTLNKLPILQQ